MQKLTLTLLVVLLILAVIQMIRLEKVITAQDVIQKTNNTIGNKLDQWELAAFPTLAP